MVMDIGENEAGQDGGIGNFLDDIYKSAFESNGFVLEIGVATGTGSTVAVHNGLVKLEENGGEPLHVSVDERDYMRAKPIVPWWHLVIGDSRHMSTYLKVTDICKDRKPGVIFIDTDHDYKQMKSELDIWRYIAGEETVWLFHDTHMFGFPNDDMVKAIEGFAEENGWVYEDWRPQPHGLGRMARR